MSSGHARMQAWVESLGAQLRAGAELPGLDRVQTLDRRPARAVLCGMGGSAMAGALVPLLWPGRPLPWTVHRDAGLPDWADADTLVIASSYSGETAETLAALAAARRRGCPVAALTTGGRLAAAGRGEDGGAPFPVVTLPAGQPPRTALGFSLAGVLHVLHRLGLADDPGPGLAGAAAHLEAGRLVRDDAAPAAALASDLADRFVMIYTSGREAHPVGRRWQAQLNENAKLPAAVAAFPELCHNELVGWALPPRRRDAFALVVLRAQEDPTERRRADATLELVAGQFAAVHEVHAAGSDQWARVLGLIQFGDLVSCAVARRREVDPVPIDRIDALKARLRPEE